jgi:hypothetical protein
MKPGPCCGFDPCAYAVHDNVTVLYFDDIILDVSIARAMRPTLKSIAID